MSGGVRCFPGWVTRPYAVSRLGENVLVRAPTFRKTAASHRAVLFEAAGLRTLRAAGARVPRVLEVGDRHLVLEHVESGGPPSVTDEERFGRELADLHRRRGGRFGAVDGDPQGFLGRCPIDLTGTDSWAASYLDHRVRPLARQAVAQGVLDPAALPLVERLGPEHLPPEEPPSLVHGDLWAGNRLVDPRGDSWLIDPSAQYGHRELDLAMMRLFGGFGEAVFRAYEGEHPPADGWRDRVPVHQLAPLLVHAILFGGGYGEQTLATLRQAVVAR